MDFHWLIFAIYFIVRTGSLSNDGKSCIVEKIKKVDCNSELRLYCYCEGDTSGLDAKYTHNNESIPITDVVLLFRKLEPEQMEWSSGGRGMSCSTKPGSVNLKQPSTELLCLFPQSGVIGCTRADGTWPSLKNVSVNCPSDQTTESTETKATALVNSAPTALVPDPTPYEGSHVALSIEDGLHPSTIAGIVLGLFVITLLGMMGLWYVVVFRLKFHSTPKGKKTDAVESVELNAQNHNGEEV